LDALVIVFGIEKAEESRVQIVVDLHERRSLFVFNGLLSRLRLRKKRPLLLNGRLLAMHAT
jgi:hypothetical protein